MIENSSIQLYNSHTLWLSLISLQSTTFTTTGRGSIPGTPFSFTVSRNPSAGGRHYAGEDVDGYGNEMWIVVDGVRRSKSISRSTVDRAYEVAIEKQRTGEKISGPKSLGNVYGASYIWPIFVRLGVIKTDPQPPGADAHTAGKPQEDTAEQGAEAACRPRRFHFYNFSYVFSYMKKLYIGNLQCLQYCIPSFQATDLQATDLQLVSWGWAPLPTFSSS